MCDGVRTLTGQTVMLTGTIDLYGAQTTRESLTGRLKGKGITVLTRASKKLTLVVEGDLRDNVVDPVRGWSIKLRDAIALAGSGRHVHIVSVAGFSQLMRGEPAQCLTHTFVR